MPALLACLAAILGGSADGLPIPAAVAQSPFGIVNPWPGVGREMGASWCRCGAGSTQLGNWPGIQPLPGVFDFGRAEREWATYYVPERLVPAPILGYTPPWAARAPEYERADRMMPDLWAWHRFCKTIARRFSGRVWFWEVWNEPNIGFFHGTIADYVDLLKTAAVAIAAANPKARVIFGGLAGADAAFLSRAYAYSAAAYFDIMAVHPYQWSRDLNENWLVSNLAAIRRCVEAGEALAKPIWVNEIGWPTAGEISQRDQARLLAQALVHCIAQTDLGVERVFWYCVKDWGGPGYGLLDTAGRPKLAWRAYRALVHVAGLAKRRVVGRLRIAGIVGWVFAGGPHDFLAAVWAPGLEPVEVAWPDELAAEQAWDMLGQPIRPPSGRCKIGPEPIYIALRQAPPKRFIEPKQALATQVRPRNRLPLAWLSLYPQPGCSLPYLIRGGRVHLKLRLFNGSQRPIAGQVLVTVRAGGQALVRTSVAVSAAAESDVVAPVSILCPPGAPGQAAIEVTPRLSGAGRDIPAMTIPCLVQGGPGVNFLANSHLERELYLSDAGRSGTAPSVRFGSQWEYRLRVPFECSARIRLDVGAHRANEWSVLYSQDRKDWKLLMRGCSNRAWREGKIERLAPGWLYLRMKGNDQQVGEVRVEFLGR